CAVDEFGASRHPARQLFRTLVDNPGGCCQDGTRAQLADPFDLVGDESGHTCSNVRASLLNAAEFFCDIRHDTFCCVGGGGCPHICNIVEQRSICLVADRTHDRCGAGCCRAQEGFIAEYQK